MGRENEPILECSVCINGLAHHTWQGRVLSGGEEVPFRSELELLRAIERMLDGHEDGGRGEELR